MFAALTAPSLCHRRTSTGLELEETRGKIAELRQEVLTLAAQIATLPPAARALSAELEDEVARVERATGVRVADVKISPPRSDSTPSSRIEASSVSRDPPFRLPTPGQSLHRKPIRRLPSILSPAAPSTSDPQHYDLDARLPPIRSSLIHRPVQHLCAQPFPPAAPPAPLHSARPVHAASADPTSSLQPSPWQRQARQTYGYHPNYPPGLPAGLTRPRPPLASTAGPGEYASQSRVPDAYSAGPSGMQCNRNRFYP